MLLKKKKEKFNVAISIKYAMQHEELEAMINFTFLKQLPKQTSKNNGRQLTGQDDIYRKESEKKKEEADLINAWGYLTIVIGPDNACP